MQRQETLCFRKKGRDHEKDNDLDYRRRNRSYGHDRRREG
jgi:hypothetical protein